MDDQLPETIDWRRLAERVECNVGQGATSADAYELAVAALRLLDALEAARRESEELAGQLMDSDESFRQMRHDLTERAEQAERDAAERTVHALDEAIREHAVAALTERAEQAERERDALDREEVRWKLFQAIGKSQAAFASSGFGPVVGELIAAVDAYEAWCRADERRKEPAPATEPDGEVRAQIIGNPERFER